MLHATERSNARGSSNKTSAYFYGNMGDSIERRHSGLDGSPFGGFGNGSDIGQGAFGAGSSWNAQGMGNYFGTGLLNGFGRMFGGAAGGANGGFTYLKRFSSNAAFNHQIIAQCHMAYLGYGIVRNIVDLYADFAAEGIEIEHPDASVRNFYRTWARKIGLEERAHNMFLNLFVSGQTFVHRRWATLDDNEKRAMKRSEASDNIGDVLVVRGKTRDVSIEGRENDFIDWFFSKKGTEYINDLTKAEKSVGEAPPSATEEALPENKDKQIPWGYTFLNPLQMEMRGRKIRGDSYWVMALDKRDALDVARGLGMRSSQDLGTTEVNIPREFLTRMNAYQGPGSGYSAEIKLSKEELAVVQAPGKWDWFDWAVPFVFPCLRALYYKDCLRSMEIKACQSIINAVFLYKLGNMEKGMPAEDEHFERLADMLQMPGSVMNILWNENISAEVIQPNVQGVFDIDKHDSADRDIMSALGVPEVLVGGKGGNFSSSYVAVATVLERLESYRVQVKDWLMGELKIIADAMGFQKLPTVKYGRTSLQDEKAYQAFVTGLFDRNILSADTLLREADTSVDTEVAKMKEENELREQGILEMRGPFVKPDNKDGIPQPPPPPAAPAGIGKKPGAKKPGAKTPKTPNGRPTGTGTGPTGKQANPRKPKGQGVAKLSRLLELHDQFSEHGRTTLARLEEYIGSRVLQAKAKDNPGIKHLKQLKLEERDRLEQMIYNVFSHMPAPDDGSHFSDDFIINMLRSDAAETVKVDVLNIYTDKVSQYSQTYGKVPTREMRRQFMVSAWTQKAIKQHIAQKPDILRG
jgi:hypothetical protein